jgi:hypothetical protein
VNPRLLYRLVPLLVALVVVFAGYHVYAALFAMRRGNWPFAAFYALFSLAGLALARALWSARKQIDRKMRDAG